MWNSSKGKDVTGNLVAYLRIPLLVLGTDP